MHKKTLELKQAIQKCTTLEEKLALLKNAFAGETVYIVTCGPTLKDIDLPILRQKLKNKLVFAVKQAFDVLPTETDFHFFNEFNLKTYDYSKTPAVLRVISTPNTRPWVADNPVDIRCWVAAETVPSKGFSEDVSEPETAVFEDYLFSNTTTRPTVPGIMHNLVFYLAIHMGVSNIVTIAWDLPAPNGPYEHFYPQREKKSFLEIAVVKTANIFSRIIADPNFPNKIRFLFGWPVNEGWSDAEKFDYLKRSAIIQYRWCCQHNIGLRVLTRYDYCPLEIPRIRFEDL